MYVYDLDNVEVTKLPFRLLMGEYHYRGSYDPRYTIFSPEYKQYVDATGCIRLEKMNFGGKDLVKRAKTVWLHPKSSVPRTQVAQHFKIVGDNDRFMADVQIFPNIPYEYTYTTRDKLILFHNEECDTYYGFPYWINGSSIEIKNNQIVDWNTSSAPAIGTPFMDIYGGTLMTLESSLRQMYDNCWDTILVELKGSKLVYNDIAPMFHKDQLWFADLLLSPLLQQHSAFDSDLIEAMGEREEQLTGDTLCTVYDMLRSSDKNVRATGLKAISTMCYAQSPVSCTWVLLRTFYHWHHDHEYNSTSVKCMRKYFGINSYSSGQRDKRMSITHSDAELLMQVINYVYPDCTDQIGSAYLNQELVKKCPGLVLEESRCRIPSLKNRLENDGNYHIYFNYSD